MCLRNVTIPQGQSSMFAAPIIFFTAAVLLICFHVWVNLRQPEPYMDELFHVPQAQEFCKGLISKTFPPYDPSITTPPALYVPNAILAGLTGDTVVCETRWLRVTSAVMSFLSLALMVDILRIIVGRRRSSDGRVDIEVIWLLAFVIWLHPVNLFYANLFYTDTASLFWVLLFWRINLSNHSFVSAPFGVLGSLSRQTNMIWHAYLVFDTSISSNIISRGSKFSDIVLKLIQDNPFHVIAGIGYGLFVVVNKGIVLGDRAHHEMTIHYAMFAYFAAFHGSMFGLIQLSSPTEVLKMVYGVFSSFRLTTLLLSVGVGMTGMVLATGSRVHPFILADNRHFTFYIYRRWLLRSPWQRLSLVPVYAWCIANPFIERDFTGDIRLQHSNSSLNHEYPNWGLQMADFLSDVALLVCAYITLVPAALLEPRYFVVGSTLLCLRRSARLGSPLSKSALGFISLGMVLLNIAFVFVFTELPFPRPVDEHMPNDTSPGRFMF
ncbi:Alpha-1,2-glucosyltransferase family GT59 [Gracilaria domingensis]|nr:Alpha-1,2-glucosyltransferase family GT59 [Gracilaria domingensis]